MELLSDMWHILAGLLPLEVSPPFSLFFARLFSGDFFLRLAPPLTMLKKHYPSRVAVDR